MRKPLYPLVLCLALTLLLVCGCSLVSEGFQARPAFKAANDFFVQGDYPAALSKYAQILEEYPATGDRALFEMGILHAHPHNAQKDDQKALACFQAIIRDYPASSYRQDSEMMVFYLSNIASKDALITAQQTQIETLRQAVGGKEQEIHGLRAEIAALHAQIATLEQKAFAVALQQGPADQILIEKSQRRLTLIAKGAVLKSYKIALGGNPTGPKERQGDYKTPEGSYVIDAKNRDSRYHLALHISYPNESDRQRARELGVAPGGDIMIHGIKEGFAWVGEAHTAADWTKGCIAVTDEEIEEIFRVVPIGTPVEIRP